MEAWKLFLEILQVSLPVACFFSFVYPLVFYMTSEPQDDREGLTLSPAASMDSSGACCTLLIEGQFSFSLTASYDMTD